MCGHDRFLQNFQPASIIFCQRQNVTTFMVLYAVFATWLHRYTQESDIVIGSIVAGRRRRELEDVMGYCVNTVALRAEVSDGLTGHELLKQIRRVVVQAYDHQELPFEEVIEALSLQRERSLSPLFNVMIVCEDDPLSTFTVRDLEVAHLPWEPTASEFDLVLMVVNKADGLDWRFSMIPRFLTTRRSTECWDSWRSCLRNFSRNLRPVLTNCHC